MNTTINQHNGSGDWVAFLIGASFNLLLTISVKEAFEFAIYSFISSMIAGGVWLLYKKLADRLGIGVKKDDILDKLIDKGNQNRNNHAKD